MVGTLRLEKLVDKFAGTIASGMFAVFVLSVVSCWTLVMLIMIFWPQSFATEANFATIFRVWCFGYDPIAGTMDMSRVIFIFMDPPFFGFVIGGIWRKELLQAFREQRAAVAAVVAFVALASAGGVGLLARNAEALAAKNGFPEVPLARSFDSAPVIRLTDQNGLAYQFKPGRVTLLSAFYTHCRASCPIIVGQMKKALALAERPEDIDGLLVTMDPENDNPAALKEKFQAEGVGNTWRFLTGKVSEVNQVLDEFRVARARDANGNIGHSNVFYVIDKKGRVAFRIGLGSNGERQLKTALNVLLKE